MPYPSITACLSSFDDNSDGCPGVSSEIADPDRIVENGESPTLFESISKLGLTTKLTNIALAETKVPMSLREDARQEIHMAWFTYRTDTRLTEGQIASYANMIAHHACLRIRRELGLPVRLPGSAFRKKADGNIKVDLRRFVDPLSWDEITERLVGRQESGEESHDDDWEQVLLPNESDDSMSEPTVSHEMQQHIDTIYGDLTKRQQEILERLRQGASFGDLPELLGLSTSLVQRELSALRKKYGKD